MTDSVKEQAAIALATMLVYRDIENGDCGAGATEIIERFNKHYLEIAPFKEKFTDN